MAALSLWNPWGQLVCAGPKTIETRSWATKYRGLVAIHATRSVPAEIVSGLLDGEIAPGWEEWVGQGRNRKQSLDSLARGCFIGVVRLRGCYRFADPTKCRVVEIEESELHGVPVWRDSSTPIDDEGPGWCIDVRRLNDYERAYGDTTQGRFGWVFDERTEIRDPLAVQGQRGLWEPPRHLEIQMRREWQRVYPDVAETEAEA